MKLSLLGSVSHRTSSVNSKSIGSNASFIRDHEFVNESSFRMFLFNVGFLIVNLNLLWGQ